MPGFTDTMYFIIYAVYNARQFCSSRGDCCPSIDGLTKYDIHVYASSRLFKLKVGLVSLCSLYQYHKDYGKRSTIHCSGDTCILPKIAVSRHSTFS